MNNYKELINFVDELILENTKITFDKLCLSDQEMFVSLYIKSDSQDGEEWGWLYDCDNRDTIAHLFTNYLMKHDPISKIDFLSSMSKYAIQSYKRRMEALIEERIGIIEAESKMNAGFRRFSHKDNGEALWVR